MPTKTNRLVMILIVYDDFERKGSIQHNCSDSYHHNNYDCYYSYNRTLRLNVKPNKKNRNNYIFIKFLNIVLKENYY